jgi:hypothetical protein
MKRSLCGLAVGMLLAGCGTSSPSLTPARQTAVAASCAAVSPAQQFAMARLVFLGRMLPGRSTPAGKVLGSPATVRVVRYLKGNGPRTVRVATAVTITGSGVSVAEDGIEPRVGEIWKIYTGSRLQPFATSICGGSRMISAAQAALELWNGFPVRARPRPIIPLDEGFVVDPRTGFPDVATKLAYLEGRFALRTPLPARPPQAGRLRLVPAAEAYGRLRATENARRTRVPPLVVRSVRLGTATFVTDRGRERLPAWQFMFQRVAQPASVLAVAAPDVFVPPALQELGPPGPGNSIEDSARADRSGTRLTISFVGAPAGTGPCDAQYTVRGTANRRAVAFTIVTIRQPGNAGAICTAVGRGRTAVVHLPRPLGARVLVSSSDAGAIAVTR